MARGTLRPTGSSLSGFPFIPMQLFSQLKSPILCLAFAPDGQTLAATAQGRMQVGTWRLPEGTFRRWNPSADTWVRSLAFSADGKWLVVSDDWGMIFPYERSREVYASKCRATGGACALAFAPDRTVLAVASLGVALWDLDNDFSDFFLPTGRRRSYSAVAFAPDGRTVAAADQEYSEVSVWQLDDNLYPSGKEKLVAVPQTPSSVAFSPDGQTLASASGDVVFLYALRAGKTRAKLHQPKTRIQQLAYHPDGQLLATAATDGTVRFWETRSNREVRSFHWNIGRVRCVVFAPDGMTCAAAGNTGQVVLWDVDV
ncbi:unnamed protein product [uncultured bacterium]|nr:unnamed protein product [uncultured bacterium]